MRGMHYLAIAWFALAIFLLLFVAGRAVTLELTGTSEGNGSHVMELSFAGDNVSPEDGPLLLAYHGYNVSRDGRVWMGGESWNVTGAI